MSARHLLPLATVLCLTASAQAAEHATAHWGYVGKEGPAHWSSLSPDYEMCGKGVNQTPVDLTNFTQAELPPLVFSYGGAFTEVLNNGHTVQVNASPGDTLIVDGHEYTLAQAHFHTPSENHIDGASFPMEGHFVHVDAEGHLAVVAVMYEEGAALKPLKRLWKQMPTEPGTTVPLTTAVGPADLLPADRDYYRFSGSLTTPPCTEGVIWLVMKHPMAVAPAQIQRLSEILGGPNNRPVQSTGARLILE